jgi:TonB-dependent SusC/RagA subfamily outer membrane receptor
MPSKAKVAPPPASSRAAICPQEEAPPVIYLVDGKPVSCTSAMALPAHRIESVEILKGAAAAAFGASTTAGVVIIQTKRDH